MTVSIAAGRQPPDRLADFLGLYFHDPAVGLLRAAEADLVAARPLPRPLLDLGCGDGSFAARALDRPASVGLDRDLARARRARATGAYRAVVVGDAHRLPFREASFAAVLSNSTLEHIPGVEGVLRDAARVIAPGGTLLFTLHNDRFAARMFFWPRLFARLGRTAWTDRFRRARLRRLAMANLLAAEEWRRILDETGFETAEVAGYLRGRANAAFEALLVIARFGIGRVHVGAALRIVDRALAAVGVLRHRVVLGRVLARRLRDAARDATGEPAAILVRAQRRVAVPAEVSAPVAEGVVVAFRRARG